MKFRSCFPLALLLCTAMSFGCNQLEGDDHVRGGDGKSDSLSPAECQALAPNTDENGFCRAANGTFAPSQCCADSQVCQAAALDENGDCRSSENGQFVPASCCAAKCGNAQLGGDGFCRSSNGQFAPGACCADQCFAAQVALGSCEADSCGDQSFDGDCFCDEQCTDEGDCCANKVDTCGGNGSLPSVLELPGGTCTNDACGGQSDNGECFCDSECSGFGDCCKNKAAQCGGPGLDLEVVDCKPDACDGVEIVEGICRNNGKFAKSSCCAELAVCSAARVDAQGVCRDEENGQFVPALCCGGICESSFLDSDGQCRNGNGQFAQAGCCADLCFAMQERAGRATATGTPGCNGQQL